MGAETGAGSISAVKKWGIMAVLAAAIVIAILVLVARQGTHSTKIIGEGDRAPEFRLPSLDGKQVSLAELRGKIVIVHFWATWCPPCVEEMPKLEKLYRDFFGKDFEILAVSVDDRGVDAVRPFMEKNKLNLPVLFDPGSSIAHTYGTFKFPESYVLDRNGIVRYKVIGALDWGTAETLNAVRGLVDQK